MLGLLLDNEFGGILEKEIGGLIQILSRHYRGESEETTKTRSEYPINFAI
jgi:hypothetical protein